MLRQPRDRKDPKAIDESTDTYDTIEWLLKNVPGNNGRVGMVGTSYPAWLAVMGALDPHPALKAIVPMASPADMWIGDDFHHNGAFRLSYGLEYAYMMESSKEMTPRRDADRSLRHLRLVSRARSAVERQSPLLPRVAADLERFRPPSRLRRVLETAGVCAVAEPRHGADAQRRRLVGSGRLLRADQDLRAARETRHEEGELSRRRPVESRRLVARHRPHAGPHRFRQRHRDTLPPQRDGDVPRALPEGSGRAAGERSADVQDGRQRVDRNTTPGRR